MRSVIYYLVQLNKYFSLSFPPNLRLIVLDETEVICYLKNCPRPWQVDGIITKGVLTICRG